MESSHLLDTGGLARIIPDIPVYNCRYTGGKTEEIDKAGCISMIVGTGSEGGKIFKIE